MNDCEIPPDLSEAKGQYNNSKDTTILYDEYNKENDLIQFINKTQQQGFNCIDLSKRNIKEFPTQLLNFTTLQYLYLEGNQLTQLPNDLFSRLPNLKWLDLRNNQLMSIPSHGLIEHPSLQYLLIGGNHIRALPYELGKVKTLTALNLDGNPLDYPPFEIIKQGIKAVRQYLRDKLPLDEKSTASTGISLDESGPNYDKNDHDDDDDDDIDRFRPKTSSYHYRRLVRHRMSKSEIGYHEGTHLNLLPPHLQPCLQFKRMTYSPTRPTPPCRSRPQSELRFSQPRAKSNLNKTSDLDKDICTVQTRPQMQIKRGITIEEEIQQLYQKSYIQSKNFEEPIVQTPFHIDPNFSPIINKNPPDLVKFENRPNTTRKYILHDDEERRRHDQQIQDRIRQITDQMLKRRLEARQSLFEENRQVKLELRELRRLESTANPNRSIRQINNRQKTPNDNLRYQRKS